MDTVQKIKALKTKKGSLFVISRSFLMATGWLSVSEHDGTLEIIYTNKSSGHKDKNCISYLESAKAIRFDSTTGEQIIIPWDDPLLKRDRYPIRNLLVQYEADQEGQTAVYSNMVKKIDAAYAYHIGEPTAETS